jgi:transcriptional regulator with XRE-family HTH domain
MASSRVRLGLVAAAWRVSRGWKQEDVATRLGMARTSYSALENDKRQICFSELVALVGLYGVSLDKWLSFSDDAIVITARRILSGTAEERTN